MEHPMILPSYTPSSLGILKYHFPFLEGIFPLYLHIISISYLIKSTFVLVQSPFLVIQSSFLLLQSTFMMVQSPFLLVKSPFMMVKSSSSWGVPLHSAAFLRRRSQAMRLSAPRLQGGQMQGARGGARRVWGALKQQLRCHGVLGKETMMSGWLNIAMNHY